MNKSETFNTARFYLTKTLEYKIAKSSPVFFFFFFLILHVLKANDAAAHPNELEQILANSYIIFSFFHFFLRTKEKKKKEKSQ